MVARFDVYLVKLDPTVGSEINKTRPAVIISPKEMNDHLNTVIIAPMTTKKHGYPTRVNLTFKAKTGQIVLDQIKTIDKSRLIIKVGAISPTIAQKVTHILSEMFDL